MFNWIRSKSNKAKNPKDKLYSRKFTVEVSIDHPRIIPHVVTARVIIDAENRAHAIRQVKQDMKISIGRIYVMQPKRLEA